MGGEPYVCSNPVSRAPLRVRPTNGHLDVDRCREAAQHARKADERAEVADELAEHAERERTEAERAASRAAEIDPDVER